MAGELRLPAADEPRCLNCSAVLSGEYCAQCGQHVKHHVHSTRELFGELIEDLIHADRRVWRTLKPLLLRPGWLTVEYLRGRRVYYTPPFRLYIVLSLLFFITMSLPSHQAPQAERSTPQSAATSQLDPAVAADLNVLVQRMPEDEREEALERLTRSLSTMTPDEQRRTVTQMINVCSPATLGTALPPELAANKTLLNVCRSVTADSGQNFGRELWHHVPKMMFFFLPLLALSMKVLYLGSRRFYAEHILFLVHFHAFAFLATASRNIVEWLFGFFSGGWAGVIPGLLTTLIVFYAPWYLYRSLRVTYGQGRLVTFVKFVLLCGAYFVSLMISLLGLTIYTALTLGH